MSSSTLTTIQNGLTVYGYSICMLLGNFGNAFIIIIFNRQRQSACGIYLVGAAVMNIVVLTFNGIVTIFSFYHSDRTMQVIIFCKIYVYLLYTIGQVPKTLIVSASIDRFLITSNRASLRAFSTPKRAKYFVLFSLIFWSLFMIPIPIIITVVYGQCTAAGLNSIIESLYTIIFISLIPSITSAIFGYLSYRNIRQMQIRVQPVGQNTINVNNNIHRRDRDLLIIVIAEVIVYVVTTALFPLIQSEMLVTQYVLPNKSFQYVKIEIFILNIAVFLLAVNSAAPFYTYLISSKSFRRDFKQLIINSYWKLTGQTPVVQIIDRTDQGLTQRSTRV
jgi:hypothetical protein